VIAASRRPDRARGVFETLLIAAGEPIELDSHLARLRASVQALYAVDLPSTLGAEALAAARQHRLGRLKMVLTPAGREMRAELSCEPVDRADVFPSPERAAELRSVYRAGGLGAHKWADRSPLPTPPEGALPLLLDEDDEVLEVSRGNVFAVLDEVLVTPAADGRILPGTARAAALGLAREAGIETAERPLHRDQLLGAEEVFLTGSIRGIEPARSLDGTPLAAPGEVGQRLAAALSNRWLASLLAAS
jgi:para-aminobenzoate synthetase / 4-amino-4-deoxychorismate lyase